MKIQIMVEAPTLNECQTMIEEYMAHVARGGWILQGCGYGQGCWLDCEASGDAPDWPLNQGRLSNTTQRGA